MTESVDESTVITHKHTVASSVNSPAQVVMCRELFKLARHTGFQEERPLQGTRTQQWYFFFTAAFWLYLRCGSHSMNHVISPKSCDTPPFGESYHLLSRTISLTV